MRSRNRVTAADRPMRRVTVAGKLVTGDLPLDPHPLKTDWWLRRVVTPDRPVTQQAIASA